MKQCLPLLATHVSVRVAQNEPNRGKEVTLAGSIAADDYIVFRGEWLNDGLVLVTAIERFTSVAKQGDKRR